MNFLIITHVLHKKRGDNFYAYAPYVREMNLWLKYVDKVTVMGSMSSLSISAIDLPYKHDFINFIKIPSIAFTSFFKAFRSVLKIPIILFRLFSACWEANHIHLRCPGNIGLLGCLVQICFPSKVKTAKYAGNWDPNSKQPLSYRIQKLILRNTFLTRNIKVLVYGDWKNQTKNIKSFFTATFNEVDIEVIKTKDYTKSLNFLFIGSLVSGKRPLFAIQVVEKLLKAGKNVYLEVYGDGVLREELQSYILKNNLESVVNLNGNKPKNVIKKALEDAHFLLLPSKSEGWPKAIAEAMFFGVIPISTSVSCVPFMLNYGDRGILINTKINEAFENISNHLRDTTKLEHMAILAKQWSQKFTLDYFEEEISKLIKVN